MWLVMALAVADAVLTAVRAGHRLCAILLTYRSHWLINTSELGGNLYETHSHGLDIDSFYDVPHGGLRT